MTERLGILISGGGTTMAEIIKAVQSQEIPNINIACVISSRSDAGGLIKAKNLSISDHDLIVINPKDYKDQNNKTDRNAFGKAILNELKKREVSVVTQNGWLPLTPENVVEEYSGCIFNQHPGPLPYFGGKGMHGLAVHAAVLNFVKEANINNPFTEMVTHRVTKNYDEGSILLSEKVLISPNDTPETLQAKSLPVEHHLQIKLLQDFISKNLSETRCSFKIQPNQTNLLVQSKIEAINCYPNG